MYSISEVSKIIGVSRQSVYKKIDREGLHEYLVDGEKGKVITDKGFNILKGMFTDYLDSKSDDDNLHSQVKKNSNQKDNLQVELSQEYIDILKKEIDRLNNEVEYLKNKLDEQIQHTANLTRVFEQSQILHKQQNDKIMMLEQPKKKYRSWFPFFKTDEHA